MTTAEEPFASKSVCVCVCVAQSLKYFIFFKWKLLVLWSMTWEHELPGDEISWNPTAVAGDIRDNTERAKYILKLSMTVKLDLIILFGAY